jgi:hypothetical protein
MEEATVSTVLWGNDLKEKWGTLDAIGLDRLNAMDPINLAKSCSLPGSVRRGSNDRRVWSGAATDC